MNVFLDTNILLDVLHSRAPYDLDAAEIWTLCEQGGLRGHISVISFNNIYYIVRKLKDKRTAEKAMRALRDIFIPVPLDGQLLNQAIGAGFGDFEDAIQYHSAGHATARFLITRNVSHFPATGIPVVTPPEFLAILKAP